MVTQLLVGKRAMVSTSPSQKKPKNNHMMSPVTRVRAYMYINSHLKKTRAISRLKMLRFYLLLLRPVMHSEEVPASVGGLIQISGCMASLYYVICASASP